MSKKTIRIICIVLAIVLLAGVLSVALSSGARAVTQDEIDKLQAQRDVIRAQKKDVQEQIDTLKSEKATAMERKEALDQEITLTVEEINLINEQIAIYDEMIETKAKEVEDAVAAEEAQFAHYQSRVRTMEETNALTYLSVLLQANSLSDFLGRLSDITDIVRNDQNVKAEYIAAREHLEEIKAEYEVVQADQMEKRTELEEQRSELEDKLVYAELVISQLEDDIEGYEAAYDAKEAEEAEVQSEIDKKVEELRKQKEAEERARQAYLESLRRQQQQTTTGSTGGGTTTTGGGGGGYSGYFTWPVPSSAYITSRFGYRVHPILGTTKYHAGVDIAANYNAAINAAAGGTVQVSTYSSSYGNYCVIYHSNGMTTLYAHMNSLPIVSVGQTVSAGQQIGYVGSTGLSNGPHCHFEVRVNGANVNPLDYFSGMSFAYASDA
jgi:murein DD-endopeptidase MepM/ murein hydrolase activator NlpD